MATGGHWEQQGRQAHGWFGHGTSAQSRDAGPGGGNDGATMAATAQGIAHGVVGHLPAARRKAYEAWLAHGGLKPLVESLAAWMRAGPSERDDFRERFLPSTASDDLTDHLLKAGAAGAGTRDALREAIGHLSAAITTGR